mgnify:CR=1 FL=1
MPPGPPPLCGWRGHPLSPGRDGGGGGRPDAGARRLRTHTHGQGDGQGGRAWGSRSAGGVQQSHGRADSCDQPGNPGDEQGVTEQRRGPKRTARHCGQGECRARQKHQGGWGTRATRDSAPPMPPCIAGTIFCGLGRAALFFGFYNNGVSTAAADSPALQIDRECVFNACMCLPLVASVGTYQPVCLSVCLG